MKIIYSPILSGQTYLELGDKNVCLACQVLETQGLLQQLALHAGIHVEIPMYVKRLAAYHRGLMAYDRTYPKNIFHRSIAIDSMSVAKTLMGWRDALAVAGWNCGHVGASSRLDALAVIEANQDEDEGSLAMLLMRVVERLKAMQEGTVAVPNAYKDMEVEVLCPKDMLPDYMLPVMEGLEAVAKGVVYGAVDGTALPQKMRVIEFTDQYKAETWLAQQKAEDYDVWLNRDNKRLDNWLHMSGREVAGSEIVASNPQTTQLFLLSVQLFQRPMNVNTLLQYLYLPECPLPWELTSRLASVIVRDGGFASPDVLMCIRQYLDTEFIKEDEEKLPTHTCEERQELYHTYLPFDLMDENEQHSLVCEDDKVNVKVLTAFMKHIGSYAASRAVKIMSVMPDDPRVAQLQDVASFVDALMDMLDSEVDDTIPFAKLLQWAQSLYDTNNYCQYHAQVGCRNVLPSPANMVSRTKRTVWCDFYGDVDMGLSTDFLSVGEYEHMRAAGIRLWNKDGERAFRNFVLEMPIHQTSELLTFVSCKKQGATVVPIHPLRLQLPQDTEVVCGDDEYDKLPSRTISMIDNHREEDEWEVQFDAAQHPVKWRDMESFSALSSLLQNPLEYFMKYTLGFSDKGPTEIKMSLTEGNVAHETIETLFQTHKTDIINKVMEDYDSVFAHALAMRGALLLMPEHHLDRDKLHYQLKRCVKQLAEAIVANGLTLEACEQKEVQDLGFEDGVKVVGYIDMLLKDRAGKPVIFDLKWTSKKDKYHNAIEQNRAMQLAMYQAMLLQHKECTEAARTAFFVMPAGLLVSKDDFAECHFEKIDVKDDADIMNQLREGYKERRKEISEGRIETAESKPISELEYPNVKGVFPLEQGGTKRDPKKADNKYSDYKCFTC